MALAFDTCVLVDILRDRRTDLRGRVQALVNDAEVLHLGAVVFHELMLGGGQCAAGLSTRTAAEPHRAVPVGGLDAR